MYNNNNECTFSNEELEKRISNLEQFKLQYKNDVHQLKMINFAINSLKELIK